MRQIISKGPFWIFCVVMALLYYNGLINPEESEYWLARFGLAILILEFFSVFVVIALLEITGKVSYERMSGVSVYVITVVSVLAFAFSWLTDLWSFVYFLLAIPTKFIAFRQIKSPDESRERLRSVVVSGGSIVLSALAGVFLAMKYEGAFHTEAQFLGQYLIDRQASFDTTMDGRFLIFVGFWGMLHFSLSILFDLGVKIGTNGTSNRN
jgi:hypothetical protein